MAVEQLCAKERGATAKEQVFCLESKPVGKANIRLVKQKGIVKGSVVTYNRIASLWSAKVRILEWLFLKFKFKLSQCENLFIVLLS
jgi:hypothetical protein